MAHDETDDRVRHRAAALLPEERAVGSADPQAQAEAILHDSDRRGAATLDDAAVEHRTSAQTVPPPTDDEP